MLLGATEPPMPTEPKKPLIVISYAHADEPEHPGEGEIKWLSFVTGYLRPAIKHGAVDLWLDRLMPGGADWEREIEAKLRTCDIFILLVSRHSLSSDYVVDKEIALVRERQASGEEVHFYPLVLTPTPKIALDVFRDKNLRPRDGKPLSDYSPHERYRHMNEAAEEITDICLRIGVRSVEQKWPSTVVRAKPDKQLAALSTFALPVVSPDDPCGPDLDLNDDIGYLNFLAAIEGSLPGSYYAFNRQAIDFGAAFKTIDALLRRTLDVRLLIIGAKLAILNRDLAGFVTRIESIAWLLGAYWSEAHPRAQAYDIGVRDAQLMTLDDKAVIVLPLQYAPLVDAGRQGVLSYRDHLVATGAVNPRHISIWNMRGEQQQIEEEKFMAPSAIDHLLREVDIERLSKAYDTVRSLARALQSISGTVAARSVSTSWRFEFKSLDPVVKGMAEFLLAALAARDPLLALPNAIANVDAPYRFGWSPGLRVSVVAGAQNLPLYQHYSNEEEHRRALEACQKGGERLLRALRDGHYHNIRREYGEALEYYLDDLPKTAGTGNILLANDQARILHDMFLADATMLPEGSASRLKGVIANQFALNAFYDLVQRHNEAVTAGNWTRPFPLDAAKGFFGAVEDNTPRWFECEVEQGLRQVEQAEPPPVLAPVWAAAAAIEPPPLPPGTPDAKDSWKRQMATAANALWETFLQGRDMPVDKDEWRRAADELGPHVRPIIEFLRAQEQPKG